MSVFRCRLCRSHVQWMSTKFGGKRLLFDAVPVAIDLDPEFRGWIPGPWQVSGGTRVVMAPIDHYGREKRARIRHVVLLHACTALRQESA